MSDRLFDLDRIDAEALHGVAGALRTAGFTEEGVRDRLDLDDLAEIRLDAYPYYVNDRLRRRDPLDVAILLFLLQGIVAVEELEHVLDRAARTVLKGLGILLGERATRTYRASVSLYPVRDRLFFSDHRFHHLPWIRSRAPRDPVMYLGADSYYLARTTVRRRGRAALDLGTGSGVHALLAASHVDRAIGVDTNPRAVNFARLNALLNDSWNCVFVEGDLFRPVGGERFDLIVANPPFVPSPVYEIRYRDGGPSGADVLRRIIAALPDYLASGGVAQIVTHLGERDGEGYLERVRRWLGGANMNVHSLKVGEESIDDYAIAQARPPFGGDFQKYATDLKTWIDNLQAQRFTRVLGLILTFEWNDEGANAPWTREDEAKPPRRVIGADVARVLLAKRRARQPGILRSLDRCRASVPDDVLLVERRRPTGHGFETKDFRITFRDPALAPELEVKPLIRDLLERVDNRSTVPEIITRYARDTHQRAEEVDEKCRRAFVAMLERGLVTLDEIGGHEPPVEVHARGSAVLPAPDALIGPPEGKEPAPKTHRADEEDPLAISAHDEGPWQGPPPGPRNAPPNATAPSPTAPKDGPADPPPAAPSKPARTGRVREGKSSGRAERIADSPHAFPGPAERTGGALDALAQVAGEGDEPPPKSSKPSTKKASPLDDEFGIAGLNETEPLEAVDEKEPPPDPAAEKDAAGLSE